MRKGASEAPFPHRHLLGIEGLSPDDINHVLDLADGYVELNRQAEKKRGTLRGRTIINCFFESSTRTRTSFEVAGKRLGGDVINMSVSASSMVKGETLIDTAMTLNAMHPDVLVVRHPESGAVHLLSEKVDCAVVNAGDGSHEHPTQALLDALTIRRRKGRLGGLTVAICGDVLHSRVARSNIALLNTMGARVRVVAPRTLLPAEIERLGVEVFHDMAQGLADVDIVMMLRLQSERMHGSFVPSTREYFHFFGLDYDKLRAAKPDALIMHPGPMNRGVEIGSEIADRRDKRPDRAVGGYRAAIPASELPPSRSCALPSRYPRPVEACDEAQLHRVTAGAEEHNRDDCRRLLRCNCRDQVGRDQQRRRKPDQLGRERRQTIDASLRESVFDRDIPANDKAPLLQSLQEPGPQRCFGPRGALAEIANDRQSRLRRGAKRRERGRPADDREELAAVHSITSSARARIDGGMVRLRAPRAFGLLGHAQLAARNGLAIRRRPSMTIPSCMSSDHRVPQPARKAEATISASKIP